MFIFENIRLSLHSRRKPNGTKFMRGRALLNPELGEMTFVEQRRPTWRNILVHKEPGMTVAMQRDGSYKVTLQIQPGQLASKDEFDKIEELAVSALYIADRYHRENNPDTNPKTNSDL